MSKPLTPAEFAALPDDHPVRCAQVIPSVLPVSRATFYRLVEQGALPKPYRPSPNVATWRAGTLRSCFTPKAPAAA